MAADPNLVLSMFPGIGLLDRAFEEYGFTVVRGPDVIWGGDVHRFHIPAHAFGGIIGGPPCQVHSTAKDLVGSAAVDLIPEFVRVVHEGQPQWVVMENVPLARRSPTIPPHWQATELRDWDCGGETARTRWFWTWPFWLLAPPRRPGDPSLSVLASTGKKGHGTYAADKRFLPGDLPLEEYGRLQGVPEIATTLASFGFSKVLAVKLLGNGVPVSMGRVIAQAAREAIEASAVAV